ncbi:hypothetical protein [Actinoplanes regularis]|uniref:Uncharacterized protein n=1 Tax=Actinoplanes regularis TaxID=52697 RepID=A0A238WR02_9ACTN|nr:hypothetical protein [Actinoplanes regularis]GIE84593.1 hypothetical protein Are01nite_10730 [Actinoplanes regularis]SNR48986.1 hypothetical protein SAMN06264365_102820 [Actinoplanes regularis]
MTHFASTAAQLDACRRCAMPILVALDEGIVVRVDLLPLASIGAQVEALAAGIPTYARLHDGQLAYRCSTRLSDPRMTERVHARHACTTRRTA